MQINSRSFFLHRISTPQHVLLLLHGERLIRNQFLSTCSSTCLQLLQQKHLLFFTLKFVISGTGVENTLSLTYPHKKKSREVTSGGQGVGPSLPIHLFGNVTSKIRRTCEPQCGGAPSCWKIVETNLSNGKKYVFVLHVVFLQ